MAIELTLTGETAVLRLEGECTIEHAADLHSALLAALERAPRLVLNLEGVTAADVTCLQLICSAHRTALGAGKQLSFDRAQSELFQKTVREAGYYRSVGCHKDPCRECLWRKGGGE